MTDEFISMDSWSSSLASSGPVVPITAEQIKESMRQAKESQEQMRLGVARELMLSGVALIPCQFLQDHQFMVSQGVYDAAVKFCEEQKQKEKTNDRSQR